MSDADRIENATNWPVGLLRHASPGGRSLLVVMIKRTWTWAGTALSEAPRQLPLFAADVPWNDGVATSVRFESDRVPFKPKTDIVVAGLAYAPGGRPVRELDVGLRVGTLTQVLRVLGDRVWRRGATGTASIGPAAPFTSMPLRYERAFGGIDLGDYCPENPVGTGLIGSTVGDGFDGRPLPNLEDPRDPIVDRLSRPTPVGFGFYGRAWQPRLALCGTIDDSYRRSPTAVVPGGFSYAVFNGAHPRLQVPWLTGDEPVDLRHLTPEGGSAFRLAGRPPTVDVVRRMPQPRHDDAPAGIVLTREPVRLRLDTLVFVPEHASLYEVFRGAVPLGALDSLEIAEIRVGAG